MFPYFNFDIVGTGGTFNGTPVFVHDFLDGRNRPGMIVQNLFDSIGR
jgi:hypothetical protein